uniref:Uncharacterized protein n=1 Tax=Pipistrellus kuhlii TaxID=59472 RepID=A0A7J7S5Y1_PIPKU|nr:hypothetical protein mPipKuh1_010035 [Pipistrellus kuhlii]
MKPLSYLNVARNKIIHFRKSFTLGIKKKKNIYILLIKKNILMKEKHRSAASCTPPTGNVPTSKVHALDWNQTWDLCRNRFDSVDSASACGLKGPGFDSRACTLVVGTSPVGGVQEAADRCF